MPENPTCFDAILRRLLCTGEVPTHPSAPYIPHSNQTQLTTNSPIHKNKPNSQTNADVTPGIIARLMGLDSLPECNRVRNPDVVTRSKSVSFADYLMEKNSDVVAPASLHRRVRTSVSFTEVPEVMRLHEGQEFLVVYLDSVDEKKEEEFGVTVKKKTEEAKQGETQEVKQGRKKRENNEVIKKNKNEEKGVKRKSEKVLKVKDENRRECKAQSLRVGRQDSKGDEGKKVVSKNGSVNLREEKRVVTRPKLKKGIIIMQLREERLWILVHARRIQALFRFSIWMRF